jgi:hypothetical protein
MRRLIGGAVGLAATGLLTLAALPSYAQARPERELLGVRIMRPWNEVLRLHGPPTRIEVGAVSGMEGGQTGGQQQGIGGSTAGLNMTGPGGLPGLPSGPPPGMGGYSGMMGGGMSRPPGMMGGGMTGPPGMMGGGPMTGPPPGLNYGAFSGMGGGMRGGRFGSDEDGAGAMPGGGISGSVGTGGGSSQSSQGDGEITWVYERGQNTYMFLFNKDGRVIQIQSFGYRPAGMRGDRTARGVMLSDTAEKIYRLYGWPDSVVKEGGNLILDYSTKAKVAFQLLDRRDGKGSRVVGITIAETERNRPNLMILRGAGGTSGGGAAPGTLRGGGMPGMGGGFPSMGGGMSGPPGLSGAPSSPMRGGLSGGK